MRAPFFLPLFYILGMTGVVFLNFYDARSFLDGQVTLCPNLMLFGAAVTENIGFRRTRNGNIYIYL